MGVGKINFSSDKVEYSTPLSLFEPLNKEFRFNTDVCASDKNAKCYNYFTVKDNAFTKNWRGNCWMNPPFSKELRKWVKKAHDDSCKYGGTIVCLIPVRSNTKWWGEIIENAEVRFIIGEVNFNDNERGLWLPMCILIFGSKVKRGTFSIIKYKK